MPRPRVADTTGYLWAEPGEERTGLIAEVAPEVPGRRTYSFVVPDALSARVSLGHRVQVPLGRSGRLVQGFVVRLGRATWDATLRPIDSVVDPDSFLTQELIDLGREIALHYACPLGRALKAMTPEAARRQRGLASVRYARLARPMTDIVQAEHRISAKRRALLERLAASASDVAVNELLSSEGVSAAVLRAIVKAGWVGITTRKEERTEVLDKQPVVEPDFCLNDEQENALNRITTRMDNGGFGVTLIHGVSGSGKTELYIRAMQRAVATGAQGILLVPEIVLTTQLVGRITSRFETVAVLHSGQSETQRSLAWRQVAAGERSIVIGTRSAVFAPCPSLGIICVDEEQETSFKNMQAPRFHVRDVAIMRGKHLNIPIVLGSATPSVETWFNSEHRETYQRVSLRRRVNDRPMPKIHIIDMRDEFADLRRMVVLSRVTERLLSETLSRGEQAMLLINRRGFADRLCCLSCKTRLRCPNCSVGLVVHRVAGRSICHYCRSQIPTPDTCPNPSCGEKLVQMGLGTQRVEDVVAARFPDAKVRRVDSDTMTHRDHYQQIVDDFENRRIDVLVGTQMIAKGLDFPFVSFVGVIDADIGAVAADFRAQERLFQLMTQVAGRAGRARTEGRVAVQTSMPDLPALQHAARHDYESFVTEELELRRRVGLPPFRRIARIVLSDPREQKARQEADALGQRIRESLTALALPDADVLGPNPCVLPRLRSRYRYELLVRTRDASSMRRLTAHLDQKRALNTRASSTMIDVDPVSLT